MSEDDPGLGSYAVNSESECPWFAASDTPRNFQQVPDSSGRLRLSKPSVKVTHLIFDQMTEFVNDEYWVGVLKRMSTGRLPKGFKVVGPELVFRRRGGKVESVFIPKFPEKAGEIIDFFHRCGVFSRADEMLSSQAHEEKAANYKPKQLKWGSISRNKLILDQVLVAFAKRKTAEVGGDDAGMMDLYRLLKLAAVLGVLTSSNVVVEDNAIKEISVLLCDQAEGKWDIDFNVAPKRKAKPKQREKKDDISEVWRDYCALLVGEPGKPKKAGPGQGGDDTTETCEGTTRCDVDSSVCVPDATDQTESDQD